MSIDKIRNTIIRAAGEVPSAGPVYIERINRIRRWMLDLADQMVPIHLSVNEYGMDINGGVIERAITVARNASAAEYMGGRDEVRGALNILSTAVAEAFHYEEVAEYAAAYSASRAALQAIHSAVSATGDFDVFSLAAKASLVAEQCALAIAYKALATDLNDAPATTPEIKKALAVARADVGMAFFGALHCRIYDDIKRPIEFEQGREQTAASV